MNLRYTKADSLEKTGVDINTAEDVYVVASYPGRSLEDRFQMNKDFEIYQRRGVDTGNPRFYRSVVTTIKNIEEITKDEYYAERKKQASAVKSDDSSDNASFPITI